MFLATTPIVVSSLLGLSYPHKFSSSPLDLWVSQLQPLPHHFPTYQQPLHISGQPSNRILIPMNNRGFHCNMPTIHCTVLSSSEDSVVVAVEAHVKVFLRKRKHFRSIVKVSFAKFILFIEIMLFLHAPFVHERILSKLELRIMFVGYLTMVVYTFDVIVVSAARVLLLSRI
ncbi:hypothetical protein VNO78_11533 [Psophocarpus tetragonolobus]|uniref:Uncharacterized protein n=1 Tax=Psophocarpus tetragonolobus TaxID=3891 RepID=A0AAN9XP18_PSOTE